MAFFRDSSRCCLGYLVQVSVFAYDGKVRSHALPECCGIQLRHFEHNLPSKFNAMPKAQYIVLHVRDVQRGVGYAGKGAL